MYGWLAENLQILATLGSALGVYTFFRIGARKDAKKLGKELASRLLKVEDTQVMHGKRLDNVDRRLDNIEKTLSNIEIVLRSLDIKVDQINLRLTHFEGSFEERRYWTSRPYENAGSGEK